MNAKTYEFFKDLAAEAQPPQRGIHSQTVSKGEGVETVLFAMASGEQLSEHTSARATIVHVLAGDGEIVVAGDQHVVRAGAWLRMPPRTPHSVTARTPFVFALYLLPA
jgi:quercetin dioxygenase-like cupin family protein